MVVTPRVIVPVAVLEGEVLPEALVEFLSTVPVSILGYHEIPEQTLPEQARDEFGERASAELATLAEGFDTYGGTVETELAFTHDPAETVRRVLEETDRGVLLRPNPVRSVDAVAVAVRRPDLAPAITATVGALVGPSDASITLLYASTGEDEAAARQVLSGMATTLAEAGIPDQRITRVVERGDDVETVLLDASDEHDLVVLGEDDPGVLQWLFRSTTERVAERTLSPVLVVQRPLQE